ncbi:hypothetical protein EON65_55685 [archaeon]|nr:MAG: hypothetical protein EON65_55685 [archaeon]
MEVTGIQLSANTRRVLCFYNFMFKRPPIVVRRVPERQKGQRYSDVTAAVRALANDYGLRVVVDASPNSLPPELLTTNRQAVLLVEPISREMIESIPEFQDFIGKLKRFHLDNAAWQVVGGCPATYLTV